MHGGDPFPCAPPIPGSQPRLIKNGLVSSAIMAFFGPSRKEVWQKLSEAVDGRFVDGGWLHTDRVEVEHGGWTVTLDRYTVSTGKSSQTFTRVRAPFVNPSGFRFRIYREGVLIDLGKRFGMQDIDIGDLQFNEDFIVKANDPSAVRRLLSNHTIRELIAAQKDIDFSVKDDEGFFVTTFPKGVDELYFAVHGVIEDVERLKRLYDLFAETLDELCRIGAATEQPPNVRV